MKDELVPRIRSMIVERLFLNIAPEDMDPGASLLETYGVDSVSLLELVVGIEETFGIPMAEEDFDITHFETVNSIANFVAERIPEDS